MFLSCTSCAGDDGADSILDVDALPRLTIQEELRIGHVESPDLGFSRVDEIDVDRDGFIYVFETLSPAIRVFTETGEFVRSIGRSGQGPGEFIGPRFSFGVHGDTVWVIDELIARRITLFSRTGEVLSTGQIRGLPVDLGPAIASASLIPFEMRRDGRFASDVGMVSRTGSVADPATGPGPVRVPRVTFDASGAVMDTVGWGNDLFSRPASSVVWVPVAEGELEVEMVGEPRVDAGVFRVTRRDLSDNTVGSQEFRFRPVATADGTGFINPVSLVRLGSDESIWLRRENVETNDSIAWIVLDREFEVVGQLTLPREGFRVEWSRDDAMLVVQSDDLHIPWIVRYRLGRTP